MARRFLVVAVVGFVIAQGTSAGAVSWTIETAVSAHSLGMSLALDSLGNPHIAYRTDSGLYYAHRSSSGWSSSLVVSGTATGYNPSLVLDANDNPSIGFRQTQWDQLNCATLNGSTWSVDRVAQDTGSSWLALDNNGKPCFAYRRGTGGHLYFSRLENGIWYETLVHSNQTAEYPYVNIELEFDSTNRAHITYNEYHSGPTRLYYAVENGASWDISNVQLGGARGSSLEVADDGTPRVSFAFDSGAGVRELRYATQGVSGWQQTTVESLACGANSLDLDGSGLPYISYAATSTNDLKYAHFDGSSWSTGIVDDTGANAGGDNLLAIDANGNIHILYSYESDSNVFSIRYAYGEVPEPATLTLMLGGTLSLALWRRIRRRAKA